jgi:hypothetical protein
MSSSSALARPRSGAAMDAERGTVTRALLGLSGELTDDESGLAERICRACVDGLDIDGAALSLLTASESRQTLWASDPVAELLEDLQFTLNEGACIEAARTGRSVLVTERSDVSALFALPLQWGALNLGVLDLYRDTPGGLSAAQWRDAIAAVDTATLLLLGQRTEPPSGGGHIEAWLHGTTSYRAEIHQATGMVMDQLGVSATDALARLRGHAFAQQQLLIDVARDVVTRKMVFTDDMA